MPEPTDRELLATVARTEPATVDDVRAALEMLYDRHAQAVLHFAEHQLGDASLAEDVCQDVFVAVARHAGKCRGTACARGWLLAIAGNRIRDLRREAHRRHRREAAVARPEADNATTWQFRDEFSVRLAALPEPYRLAVELRLRDQLRFAELAAVLGVSLRTAKHRVTDGLARLRAREQHR